MKFIIMLVVVAFVTVKAISAASDVGSSVTIDNKIATEQAIEDATR